MVTIVRYEGFLVALEQINFVKTLSAAVRTTMHQFDAVPSMLERLSSKLILQFCHERNQKIAFACAAVFLTLVEICNKSPNGNLKSLVEKTACLLVQCNIFIIPCTLNPAAKCKVLRELCYVFSG